MIFHVDHELVGAHVHVRVFSAPQENHTFASLGALTMRPDDWRAFRALLVHHAGGDVRPDGTIRVEAEEP